MIFNARNLHEVKYIEHRFEKGLRKVKIFYPVKSN